VFCVCLRVFVCVFVRERKRGEREGRERERGSLSRFSAFFVLSKYPKECFHTKEFIFWHLHHRCVCECQGQCCSTFFYLRYTYLITELFWGTPRHCLQIDINEIQKSATLIEVFSGHLRIPRYPR
jgi:hypothetical protein